MRVISAPPARVVSPDSIDAAFSGDWSHGVGEGYRITGDALGKPRSGYLVESEAAWRFVYISNDSGWNQALDGNDGRTAAVGLDLKIDNYGQGDVIPYFAQCFVASTRPGATNYLASPECGILGGGMFAGANGVYLDADEINCDDRGFDAACAGVVRNFGRTNAAGRISAWWVGVRLQSIGTKPIDSFFSAVGPGRFGLDLSAADLGPDAAAITLALGQRIYGAAMDTDPSRRFPTRLNDDWIEDDPSYGGWNMVVGGHSLLRVSKSDVTSLAPLKAAAVAGAAPVRAASTGGIEVVGAGAALACANDHVCDDVSGEYMLTTGGRDHGLMRGSALRITFDHVRDHIPNCAVQLQDAQGSPLLVGKVETQDRRALEIRPAAPLAVSTAYSVTYVCGGA
jgi:hypothetical protein